MEREEGVERRRPSHRTPGQTFRRFAELDGDAEPFGAALLVAEHAVHHRHGVGSPSQAAGGRPSRPFPGKAEPFPTTSDVVEVTGERVDHQALAN